MGSLLQVAPFEHVPQPLTPSSKNSETGEATGIEVIQDPYSIQSLYRNLIQSAEKEIALLLPTTSAFVRERKIGIVQSLQEAASRGVIVRVLTPAEETFAQEGLAIFGFENIEVRRIKHKAKSGTSGELRTKILIVDNKEYLVVELKDDSKETFVEAVRLAIYSTTQSTVNAYLMLFENLWEQSELYDQLEAHDKMQKEFIDIAAHELRTPIQPIISVVSLLQPKVVENRVEKFELTREEYDILLRNTKRMNQLATNILEVSRIESHTVKLKKEKFDMNEKIRNVIRDVRGTSTDLQIIELLGTEPILVEADKVKIFEVISNLINNAIKFTEKGRITVKAEKVPENVVQVEVNDTGIGIDIMPRIFEKFATNSDQGSGLGLFICKNIIEAHGGKIWAENNKDQKGATFAFTLPMTDR